MTNFADVFSFTSSLDHLRKQYKKLSLSHHPDKGGSDESFRELKYLYNEAINAITNKEIWIATEFVILPLKNKNLKFNWAYKLEQPECYIFSNEKYIVQIMKNGNADLGKIAQENLSFIYSKNLESSVILGLKKTIDLIPKILFEFSDIEKGIIVFEKPKNIYPLSKVLDQYRLPSGLFPIPHSTWMAGRLFNLMSFFQATGIVHGGLSVENLWVNLDSHQIYPIGGWQFTRKIGEKYIALPPLSARFIKENIAKNRLTREIVRHIIQSIFVDPPENIRLHREIPTGVLDFLSLPFGEANLTYQRWETIRNKTWERKFVKFNYQPEKLK